VATRIRPAPSEERRKALSGGGERIEQRRAANRNICDIAVRRARALLNAGSRLAPAWVADGTVGIGGAWQPAYLQGFGHPISLFAEYHHTWWQNANFNTPAASPFFNYTFRREDDVVKVGFTVDLSAAPPPAAPSYPVKAPALK
jgi:hypothetical protein